MKALGPGTSAGSGLGLGLGYLRYRKNDIFFTVPDTATMVCQSSESTNINPDAKKQLKKLIPKTSGKYFQSLASVSTNFLPIAGAKTTFTIKQARAPRFVNKIWGPEVFFHDKTYDSYITGQHSSTATVERGPNQGKPVLHVNGKVIEGNSIATSGMDTFLSTYDGLVHMRAGDKNSLNPQRMLTSL